MPSKFNMMTATLATQGVVAKVTFLGPKSDDVAPAEQTSFMQADEQTPGLMCRVLDVDGVVAWSTNMKPTDTFKKFFDLFNEGYPAPEGVSHKLLLGKTELRELMSLKQYPDLGELRSKLGNSDCTFSLDFTLVTVPSARTPKRGEFIEILSTSTDVWQRCMVTNVSGVDKKFFVDAKAGAFSFNELAWEYRFRLLGAEEAKTQVKLHILVNLLFDRDTQQKEIRSYNDFTDRYCCKLTEKGRIRYDLDGIPYANWFERARAASSYRNLLPCDLFKCVIESPSLFERLALDIQGERESYVAEIKAEYAELRSDLSQQLEQKTKDLEELTREKDKDKATLQEVEAKNATLMAENEELEAEIAAYTSGSGCSRYTDELSV